MQALIVKRITDELLAPPKERPEPEQPQYEPEEDGPAAEIVVHDEDGRLMGTARLVSGVGVYVMSDGYGTPHSELNQCLHEEDSDIRVIIERGRITALIYLPDPNRPAPTAQALRADDV